MRRTVIALIFSIFLLGGGLHLLKSEDSNTKSSVIREQPLTSSKNMPQQPEQRNPITSSIDLTAETETNPVSPSNVIPGETAPINKRATSLTSSKKATKKVNVTSQDGVSTASEKSKPILNSPQGHSEGSSNGLSPLLYKGLKIELIGININIQPRL